jgi:ribosomal protein S18 acetylase RimI-like enzyme
MIPTLSVRPAVAADVPAMAAMAARLVQMHHTVDPLRFMMPERVQDGYAWWFGRELPRPEVVMRVADRAGVLIGYSYARLEERDWNSLLEAHGALHDIFVDEPARGSGVGAALLGATLDGLRGLGAPRVVLSTMWSNTAAQRLFARGGFRNTMIEMTCELAP